MGTPTLDNRLEWLNKPYGYFVFRSGVRATADEKRVYALLQKVSSFHFCSRLGFVATVRKQKPHRSSECWYAYKKVAGKTYSVYLGKTANVTIARLEEAARELAKNSPDEIRLAQERRGAIPGRTGWRKRFTDGKNDV